MKAFKIGMFLAMSILLFSGCFLDEFLKRFQPSVPADMSGWSPLLTEERPEWVSGLWFEDSGGVSFVSIGEALSEEQAALSATNFARLNLLEGLRAYTEALFDTVSIGDYSAVTKEIAFFDGELSFTDGFSEQGFYPDEEESQYDAKNPLTRFYLGVFLSEGDMEQMIASAWASGKNDLSDETVGLMESSLSYLK